MPRGLVKGLAYISNALKLFVRNDRAKINRENVIFISRRIAEKAVLAICGRSNASLASCCSMFYPTHPSLSFSAYFRQLSAGRTRLTPNRPFLGILSSVFVRFIDADRVQWVEKVSLRKQMIYINKLCF